ncbi:hypothetical protein J8273_0263 [Carpediemonas membranifera]|uniref:Uncharacterized protein n=1 Tax=Carpediemonas membranifera TaxID=201153 RepID=A0A8J6E0F5_9EUKA|nr:hypothetical protein J8273_0263 [Carpediemonas membranifera]|eukprot:KAG9395049.1 hypothetical protein J8273_0263 [Carpediemonas membranifera]
MEPTNMAGRRAESNRAILPERSPHWRFDIDIAPLRTAYVRGRAAVRRVNAVGHWGLCRGAAPLGRHWSAACPRPIMRRAAPSPLAWPLRGCQDDLGLDVINGQALMKATLIVAHAMAVELTQEMAGDVPLLLSTAYTAMYGHTIPGTAVDGECSIETLRATIRALLNGSFSRFSAFILPSRRKAVHLLELALTTLHPDGPALSMGIALRSGEDLPMRLYTLLHGTVWAILMQAGADPDLDGRSTVTCAAAQPYAFGKDARAVWFMCKKFFMSHAIVAADGTRQDQLCPAGRTHIRLYNGRVFTRGDPCLLGHRPCAGFGMVRLPPVLALHTSRTAAMAVTPAGLFGFGDDDSNVLGLYDRNLPGVPLDPCATRVTFDEAPALALLEARLPPGRKDAAIWAVAVTRCYSVLVTPVGVVASGSNVDRLGCVADESVSRLARVFRPVPLPQGFLPTVVMTTDMNIVLGSADGQLVAGHNSLGQLGLGHTDALTRLVPAPVPVASVPAAQCRFTIFESAGTLVFAGRAIPSLCPFMDRPPFVVCPDPVPLVLPPVLAVLSTEYAVAFITADGCVLGDTAGTAHSFPWSPDAMAAEKHAGRFTLWFTGGDRTVAMGDNTGGRVRGDLHDAWIAEPVAATPPTGLLWSSPVRVGAG